MKKTLLKFSYYIPITFHLYFEIISILVISYNNAVKNEKGPCAGFTYIRAFSTGCFYSKLPYNHESMLPVSR